MYYRQKMKICEICSVLKRDYRTVRRYLDSDDFNVTEPAVKVYSSKLDPWKEIIVQWLTSDQSMPRKQRHTAKRIYDRLVSECEGFSCSYETVNRFVQKKRREMRLKRKEAMIPLDHSIAGIAQGDFGDVWFMEKGSFMKDMNLF